MADTMLSAGLKKSFQLWDGLLEIQLSLDMLLCGNLAAVVHDSVSKFAAQTL